MRILVLIIVAACGSGAESTGVLRSASELPPADYCERYAHEWCATFTPCCQHAGFEGKPDRCERAVMADCADATRRNLAQGLAFQQDRAQVCLDGFSRITRDCRTLSPDDPDRPVETIAACAQLWTGTVQPGGSCRSTKQCASAGEPVECAFSGTNGYEGVCRRVSAGIASIGDTCGSFADGSPDLGCADGSWCSLEVGFEGRCQVSGDLQARCAPGDHDSCRSGLACDPASQRCAAVRGLGEACGSTRPDCAAGTECNGDTQTCAPLRQLDEPCSNRRGERCATELACRDDRCVERDDGDEGTAITSPGICSITNGTTYVPLQGAH